MPDSIRQLVTALAAVVFLLASVPAVARELLLSDLRKEITLADPQIAPDGSKIAVLVGTNDFERNTVPIRVDMVDAFTGRTRALPLPFDDVQSVRWSPGGTSIAFLASRGGSARQLYVSSPSGGHLRALTDGAQDVQYFAWRPDGQAIAFVRGDPPPAAQSSPKFRTSFVVGDNDYRATAAPLPAHLWLVAVTKTVAETPAAARLTGGSWSLPQASLSLSQPYLDALITPQHMPSLFFCWYPDNRHIAFTQMPDAYIAHADRAVMQVLDTTAPAGANDRLQRLTSHTGFEAGCDVSADGSKLAYWYPSAGQAINASAIFVTDANARGPNGLDVTRRLDRSPWVVRWMPDGLSLLVLAHDGTRELMWRVGLDASARALDIGDLSASGASVSNGGEIAFVASGPQTPTELYLLSNAEAAPRKLTSYNRYFSSLQLGAVREVDWTLDGHHETGVLTYPPGFVAGRRYPLVLQIHGWPQYASQQAFDTDYPGLTQLLAAHGYLVFEPNYRGSDDEGNAFETAVFRDTVAGPGRDILAGIAAVERLGIVDSQRIGISGWSYGGLLTAWLITQDHRWKAAMAGGAPIDIPVDYAIGSYNVLDRYFYGDALWSSKAAYDVYVKQSPITFAWNITTPTLIMADTGDTTVPVVHSYELYHALKDRGVPVEFVAYVSDEHYPSDPVSSEDIYRRWVGWFDHYLR
jgi:dipeptidyl aminopeptidase/acylaminoacyl peptidase